MCGIAAVWGPDATALAEAIANRLGHRGPDGQGAATITGAQLSLAHRRLSIIDPDGGQQPFVSNDGRAALVANGMIYNDLDLRASLPGETFTTDSDSESIFQAVLRDGLSAAADLDGMFAFVMTDGEKVMAARDPIGIKPLYIGRGGENFCFASEIKALLPELDEIREFPPGHVFDSTTGLRRYYTLPEPTEEIWDLDEAKRTIRRTLTRAVEKRMRSDVPLGVFLSGGLDSSLIAALAVQYQPNVKSFSVGLAGSPDLEAARRVADHLGTDHHEYVLTPDEVMRDLPDILFHLESFDQDLVRSAVPCFYVSRLAAQHVKVVLTGEGADELFAGYSYHKEYSVPGALHAELHRSIGTMHNINLQRVDRMTMAHGLEARVPFLDRNLLDVAFRIPVALKLPADNRIEKWILRKAFDDLLPDEILWRDKAQFDQGSGVDRLLQDTVACYSDRSSTADQRAGRSDEETTYHDLLTSQFDQPEILRGLVAHWDDVARVDDRELTHTDSTNSTPTAITQAKKKDGSTLEDFSRLYDLEVPHPYFQRMQDLDYRIPESASLIYRWCVDELRRIHDVSELTVVDLCSGYGINGALMRFDLPLDDLYDYFQSGDETPRNDALFDRFRFAPLRNSDLHIVGLDIARNALQYSRTVGFINEGYSVNLETEAVPDALLPALTKCSLITVTGGFSFIGASTFNHILEACDCARREMPWIVGFPPVHTELSEFLRVFHNYGYVVQPLQKYRFKQRQFTNALEKERETLALARAGIVPSGEGYFEARLLVAQPPGMPLVPDELVRRASLYSATTDSGTAA